jgi:hypothetical protein
VALISQRCNRSKALALRPPKDSVNALTLNQSTQKGNFLRVTQQVDEPTARAEEFHCGFAGRHDAGSFDQALGPWVIDFVL